MVPEIINAILISVTVVLVSINESLPYTVKLCVGYSLNKLLLVNKVLVNKWQACETMGTINMLCTDKTGLLTENKMYLVTMWNGSEYY